MSQQKTWAKERNILNIFWNEYKQHVESPSLEVFEERLDIELSAMLIFGDRLDLMVLEVFPSLTLLFCDNLLVSDVVW